MKDLASKIVDKPLSAIAEKLQGVAPEVRDFVMTRARAGREAVEAGMEDLAQRDPGAASAIARALGAVKNAATSEPLADFFGHAGNVASVVGDMMPTNPIGRAASMTGAGLNATSAAMNAARAARGLRGAEALADVAEEARVAPSMAGRAAMTLDPVDEVFPPTGFTRSTPRNVGDALEHAYETRDVRPLAQHLGLDETGAANLDRNLTRLFGNLDDPTTAASFSRLMEFTDPETMRTILTGLSRNNPDAFLRLSQLLNRAADVAGDPAVQGTLKNVGDAIGRGASAAAGFVPGAVGAGLNKVGQVAPAVGNAVSGGLDKLGQGLRTGAKAVENVGNAWRRDPQMSFDFGEATPLTRMREAVNSSFDTAETKVRALADRGFSGLAAQLQAAREKGPVEYAKTLFKLRGDPIARRVLGDGE